MSLVFLIAACVAQTAAPRPSDSPVRSTEPTASARAANLTSDVLFIRSVTNDADSNIVVIDARTGEKIRSYPDAVISLDRSTLFWTARANGAAQTVVHVVDVWTARELRSLTVDGNLLPATIDAGGGVITSRGDRLVLTNSPYRTEAGWIRKIVAP